jgi:hypothetical protein
MRFPCISQEREPELPFIVDQTRPVMLQSKPASWWHGLKSLCENRQIFVGHGFSRAVRQQESMRL